MHERLVGLIKAPLKKVLGSALLSWDELVTILTEVQRIVNDRPLTYLGDGDDMPPLTPNSLLGERYIADVEDDALESPIGHHQANVRFRYLNRLREHFLQRWTCEYLLGLRYFHQSRSHSLAVGDIVLIMDDLKKRSKWKMARIMKIFSGRDGGKRVVLVRAGNREFLRPVQRLVPLEVSSNCDCSSAFGSNHEKQVKDHDEQNKAQDHQTLRRTRTRTIHAPKNMVLSIEVIAVLIVGLGWGVCCGQNYFLFHMHRSYI